MNTLLFYFAIPLATIILSAILQTFINCPFKVAGIFFSIFIVLAIALSTDTIYIVLAFIYTILSLITAFITMLITNRTSSTCSSCSRCSSSSSSTSSSSCPFRR